MLQVCSLTQKSTYPKFLSYIDQINEKKNLTNTEPGSFRGQNH